MKMTKMTKKKKKMKMKMKTTMTKKMKKKTIWLDYYQKVWLSWLL